jgi:outer membrane protein TolC
MNAIWLAALVFVSPAGAQDTLRLGVLQREAVERDPRARQIALQEAATELRLLDLAVERVPGFTVHGEATHQSEVPSLPIEQPGRMIPQPPKRRYETALDVEQLLYDGGALQRRRATEEARLRAELARVAAALHPLRSEVNQAFFRALLLQARGEEVNLLIADLAARLEVLRVQVRQGAALPGDTAVLRAEILKAEQNRSEVAADYRAAVALVGELTGVQITGADVLELPNLADEVRLARAAADPGGATRVHPRYAVFDAQREELRQQLLVVQAEVRPQVFAFGQLAYGRPGPKQFTDELHEYWLAGVRLRWRPWTWGATRRQREQLRLQQQILDTEEAAFTAQLRRETTDEIQRIASLEAAVVLDAQILALREQVERQARAQLAERVITPAQYVDVRTDLQEARVAQRRHRIELEQARAQYLVTLGVVPL